jgi:uncharacterized protein (TIGR03435 family)
MKRAPIGRINASRSADAAGGAGASTSTATDPTGGLTVFEAVDKYMGLKLAEQKHPMSVVVIDHVNRTPTDN